LNLSEAKNFKTEAVTLVSDFFKIKGAIDISKTRSKGCSIKEIYFEHYGYDVDEPLQAPNQIRLDPDVNLEHMQSVLNALPDFRSMKPTGTPQEALLRHYRYEAAFTVASL
jgi:hypothetical protein